ncbi:hypothetical protein BJ912DRAFT_1044786 [Pholiota molesta]|nr:hypothetical protein BJ912DRAFT_1044786 [Pholiota molesta]
MRTCGPNFQASQTLDAVLNLAQSNFKLKATIRAECASEVALKLCGGIRNGSALDARHELENIAAAAADKSIEELDAYDEVLDYYGAQEFRNTVDQEKVYKPLTSISIKNQHVEMFQTCSPKDPRPINGSKFMKLLVLQQQTTLGFISPLLVSSSSPSGLRFLLSGIFILGLCFLPFMIYIWDAETFIHVLGQDPTVTTLPDEQHKLWRIKKRELSRKAPEDFPTFVITTWSFLVHRRPSYLDFGFCPWEMQMPVVNSIRTVLICKASLGGVVFLNGTADSDRTTLTLVFMINWNTFVGSGQFCFKACFNSIASTDYCENRIDLIGCAYYMPSAVTNVTFTSFEGELQDVVGPLLPLLICTC